MTAGIDLSDLRNAIREKRRPAELILEVREDGGWDEGTKIRRAENLIEQLGYSSAAINWNEICHDAAKQLLVYCLMRDFAYGSLRVGEEEANQMGADFLRLIIRPDTYLTNAEFVNGRLSEWSYITSHTFEAGLVVIGQRQVAILWFADED